MIHYEAFGFEHLSADSTTPYVQWGLCFVDANRMAEIDENGRDVITTPQRIITLVPVVLLHPAAHELLHAHVGFAPVRPGELRLPLLQTVDPTISLRIHDTRLTVVDESGDPLLTLGLDSRTAWFITLLGNAGFALVGDQGREGEPAEILEVATLALDNRPDTHQHTVIATHKGSVDDKARTQILTRSRGWQPILPGSSAPFSGPGVDGDDRLWVFYGDRHKVVFPNTFTQSCILCASPEVSREHCTPNWLADALQLMPVVAGVLCATCNNRLGEALEAPVSQLFASSSLADPANDPLMNQWMAKTAATLGAAANLRIPEPLRRSVETGSVDPALSIWASATPPTTEPFYRFSHITFTAEHKARDWFIAAFEFAGFSFLVAYLPGAALEPPLWFPMTHPTRRPATGTTPGIDALISHLMTALGIPLDIYADATGRAPAPRTRKTPRPTPHGG
jgi:hypothetical protein